MNVDDAEVIGEAPETPSRRKGHRKRDSTESPTSGEGCGGLSHTANETSPGYLANIFNGAVGGGAQCHAQPKLHCRLRLGRSDGYTTVDALPGAESGACSTVSSGTCSPHSSCGSEQWEAVGLSPRSMGSFFELEPNTRGIEQRLNSASATLQGGDDDYDMISDNEEGVVLMSACTTPAASPVLSAAVTPERLAVSRAETPSDVASKTSCTQARDCGKGPCLTSEDNSLIHGTAANSDLPQQDEVIERLANSPSPAGCHVATLPNMSAPLAGCGQDFDPAVQQAAVEGSIPAPPTEGPPFLAAPLLNLPASQAAATLTGSTCLASPARPTAVENPAVGAQLVPLPSAPLIATGSDPPHRRAPHPPAQSPAVGALPAVIAKEPGPTATPNRYLFERQRSLRAHMANTIPANNSRSQILSTPLRVTEGSVRPTVSATSSPTAAASASVHAGIQAGVHTAPARDNGMDRAHVIDMSPWPPGASTAPRARNTCTVATDAHHFVAGAAPEHAREGEVVHTAQSVRQLVLRGVAAAQQANAKSPTALFNKLTQRVLSVPLQRQLGLEGRSRTSRPVVAQDPTIVIDAFDHCWHGSALPGAVGV